MRRGETLTLFHQRSRPQVLEALVAAADPEASGIDEQTVDALLAGGPWIFAQAEAHGVLPTVMRNLGAELSDDRAASIRAFARDRAIEGLALRGMLERYVEVILSQASDLPIALVKGRTYARHLYPAGVSRPFTDLDFLAHPAAVPALSEMIEAQGFQLAVWDHDPARGEAKWIHREYGTLLIEVHTNLVHHTGLRRRISLAFDDLEGEPDSIAAQLIIALVHGAMHQYERLRQVVDILQAARRYDFRRDGALFERMVERTGGRLAAIVGLSLAGRMFNEPRCFAIAGTLGSSRYSAVASALVSRSTVLSTMRAERMLHSWRRKGFRALLLMQPTRF